MSFQFRYPAIVDRWIDGDTVIVHVDLSPRLHIHEEHVRLEGVNTPELSDPDPAVRERAQAARDFSATLAPAGKRVTLLAHSNDKYGRMLATVILPDSSSVAEHLLDGGYGEKM